MQLATITTRIKGKKRNLYWEVRFFAKPKYLKAWTKRHDMGEGWEAGPRILALTVSWVKDKEDPEDFDPDCIGVVALCDGHLDIDTLTHESVHMAKLLQTKQHTLRDEEALAYAVASVTAGMVRLATRRQQSLSAWKGHQHWNTFVDTSVNEERE